MSDARVVGVDACSAGWVAVLLDEGRAPAAIVCPNFAAVMEATPGAAVVGVDMPIGLPDHVRAADVEARGQLGLRWRSVFMTPPREVLAAATHAEAVVLARRLGLPGVSRQAFGLARKIFEVEACVSSAGERIYEVHPELCFAEMQGAPLAWSKHTWNGAMARRRLLASAGVRLPEHLDGGGAAPVDDLLDAAAAAWTACRIAVGTARTVPAKPEHQAGRPIAIWV